MRVVKPHFHIIIILLCLLLTGSVLAQDATTTPTDVPPPQVLKIWWPDILAAEDDQINSVLVAQTNAFAATLENVMVEARLRQVGTTGGIMSTLRTGSLVAEGALPTVTLIRRQDLINAQLGGYINSLEGFVPSAVQGDLDTAIQLGQVNGELFGIPYMLELQHVVYRPDEDTDYTSWAYSDVLTRNQAFVFPAGSETGMSKVVMLQYLEAGGTTNSNGELILNEEALQSTFDFYEDASDDGIIDGFTLSFTTPFDYTRDFIDGTYNAGVFTSSQYLNMLQDDNTLQVAPIPTQDGTMTGVLDGWMWIIIASDQQQQQLASDYIMWMIDPAQQAEAADALHTLPSRRTALQESDSAAVYAPYIDILNNAILPVTENGGILSRHIQQALTTILTLEQTAEQAFEDVLTQQTQ